MKLIAKLERKSDGRTKYLKCTFPAERQWPFFMREAVLTRNLGPRPYSECTFVNDSDERVVIYAK